MPNVYICFTTHAGRAPYIKLALERYIHCAKIINAKVCISCSNETYKYLPKDVKGICGSGQIEILTNDEDWGSGMKFLLPMLWHPDKPLIVVDDDIAFNKGTLEGLYTYWYSKKSKNTIFCRRARQFALDNSNHIILPFDKVKCISCNTYHELNKADHYEVVYGFPEHCGAVLYPPNAFNITESNITQIVQEALTFAPHDDDVFAHILAIRNHIKTWLIKDNCWLKARLDHLIPKFRVYSLSANKQQWTKRTTAVIKHYEKELLNV